MAPPARRTRSWRDALSSPTLARIAAIWKPRTPQRLRVTETVALGEHRFVALVECGGERFLIGGTSAAMILLAQLDPEAKEGACI